MRPSTSCWTRCFIFLLGLGVQGAALAPFSRSFFRCLGHVFSGRAAGGYSPAFSQMRPNLPQTFRIVTLGMSGFIMSVTNGLVQIACTSTLQQFGGDLYVSVMTIVNSVREVALTPVSGITQRHSRF